jgi:uroporphyrinogen decarboxylase
MSPMLETVQLVRAELDPNKALIGFVGAPFTLACYMIEGRGSKAWDVARRMMHGEPALFDRLLARIVDGLLPLVGALVRAGCDAIQVFDSWAGVLSAEDYATRCAPQTARLLERARQAGAVAIDFVNGAAQHLETMHAAPADILAVDWRLPMAELRARTDKTLQGNLDPAALFCDEATLRAKVRAICEAAGQRHVFNLGHGITPPTDPRALEIVVDEVRRS